MERRSEEDFIYTGLRGRGVDTHLQHIHRSNSFHFFTLCVFYEKYFITSVCAMTVKELARLRRRG